MMTLYIRRPIKQLIIFLIFISYLTIPPNIRLNIVEYCLYNDNPVHVLFSTFLDSGLVKDNKSNFLSTVIKPLV